jgi:RNA polymerase sigma-70 factor (ECF subfamily)
MLTSVGLPPGPAATPATNAERTPTALPPPHAHDTATLYRDYAAKVFRWARRLARSASDAEDIVQEVFLAVHRCQHLPAWVHSPSAWLLGVTFNAARHAWRKCGRSIRDLSSEVDSVSSQAPTPLEQLETRQALAKVEAALASLGDGYRDIYWLCEIQQLSGATVAALMGLHPSTLRVRRFRARAQIAEWLVLDQRRPASRAAPSPGPERRSIRGWKATRSDGPSRSIKCA